jgi:hypothetical protein
VLCVFLFAVYSRHGVVLEGTLQRSMFLHSIAPAYSQLILSFRIDYLVYQQASRLFHSAYPPLVNRLLAHKILDVVHSTQLDRRSHDLFHFTIMIKTA